MRTARKPCGSSRMWSALRSFKVFQAGSSSERIFDLFAQREQDLAKVLGIPENVKQTVVFPVAYFKGEDFKPAKRLPVRNFIHWDTWGEKRA